MIAPRVHPPLADLGTDYVDGNYNGLKDPS